MRPKLLDCSYGFLVDAATHLSNEAFFLLTVADDECQQDEGQKRAEHLRAEVLHQLTHHAGEVSTLLTTLTTSDAPLLARATAIRINSTVRLLRFDRRLTYLDMGYVSSLTPPPDSLSVYGQGEKRAMCIVRG
jgi:hypothetical protein